MIEIRIILDTTAVLGYARGSVHVGEVVAEVADEQAGFAIPVLCVAEAARRVDDDRLSGVYLLEAHAHGHLLPATVEQWRQLAGLTRVLGRADLAAALLAARDHEALILTGEPEVYGEPGRPIVIPI